ncbi:MAG: hypothetical protein E7A11_18675 [Clostridium sp.]|uniref:hypothetical protein n=1 Tax=Clostridium sp. TaxID=1506 RepID=UPI002901D0BE|nr:hypothetical protein [Clostridium sp.]MDU1127275.1 hypothetical protein [Clostridium sp.]
MKYIFEKELHYNREYLGLKFEEKYKMLNNIFNETVLSKDDKFDWLKGIDDTISGNLIDGDFGVQSGFGAEVGKEKTIIYCDFTDEEIEISTEEFKRISEIWFDNLEEFQKTGKLK